MSKLIIICGLPYAGKTKLGQALVARFGHAAVDVDVTKERLYGLGLKDDDLTKEQWNDIYAQTDQQIEDYLKSGKTVVDDSRNFRKAERMSAKAIAQRCEADFITIYVDTPVATLRQRMAENRRNPTRHDILDAEFEELLRKWETPMEDERPLVLQPADQLHDWILVHTQELS